MKKSWKKFLPLIICLAICLSLFTVSAFAEDAAQQPKIRQNEDGTWSAYDADGKVIPSGWVKVEEQYGDKTYTDWFYASKGVLSTGWQNIDNKWYYFFDSSKATYDAAPYMYSNGIGNTWDNKNDPPKTFDEWKDAKNLWWFNEDGSLLEGNSGWVSKDATDFEGDPCKIWYFVNSDGSLHKGWLQDGGSWYSLDPVMEWYKYGGVYTYPGDMEEGKPYSEIPHYFLKKDGSIAAGEWARATWKDEGGTEYDTWFYAKDDGTLATGWQNIDGKWYYFGDPDYPEANENYMIRDNDAWSGIFYVAGKGDTLYRVDKTGAMFTGWDQQYQDDGDNTWFYFDENGAMARNEWKQIDGKWYYFDGGAMAENQQVVDKDKTYYVGSDGAMVTGWNKLEDGSWNYYDDTGAQAQDEWKQVDGKWYYFNGATMAENQQVVDKDKTYYVGSDGAMATGWVQNDAGDWYNYGSDGAMQTGWVQDGDAWYYMDDNGVMLENTTTPDGYVVGPDGAWIPD